jgi:hypothetical protein
MPTATTHRAPLLPLPPEVDLAAARRGLRDQIAHVEGELATVLVSNRQPASGDRRVAGGGSPRLLSLAELEELRDRLVAALAAARRAADERGRLEESNRRLREELVLEPARHPFVRVTNEDVGDPGCADWHVRPRFGLLGMLMRWWRVRISSGCP